MAKKKKSRGRFSVLLFIIVIAFIGWQIWNSDEVQIKFVYLWPHQEEILEYSEKNKLDPFFVAAVIKNESDFRREAKSRPGAVGLMQIMPETGLWIAEQMGMENYSREKLAEPEINIRMGCWYLSELEFEFGRNQVLMLAAYNAGRGTTKQWMAEYGWDYSFNAIEQIPYADTREYVRKVLRDRGKYYQLYKNRLGNY